MYFLSNLCDFFNSIFLGKLILQLVDGMLLCDALDDLEEYEKKFMTSLWIEDKQQQQQLGHTFICLPKIFVTPIVSINLGRCDAFTKIKTALI